MKEPLHCGEVLAQRHLHPHNRQIGGKIDTAHHHQMYVGTLGTEQFVATDFGTPAEVADTVLRNVRSERRAKVPLSRSESSTWSFRADQQNRLMRIRKHLFGDTIATPRSVLGA
jgi:hypothetical protein